MIASESIFCRLIFIVLIVQTLGWFLATLAEEPQEVQPLKVVYFIPNDRSPAADRQERLGRVMKNIQEFYRKGMEANGHGSKTFETFIRFNPAVSILKKIKDTREPSLSQVLNAGRYFGFHTKVDWIDDVAGTLQTADGQSSFAVSSEKSKDKSIKVYIAHGTCWISKNDIVRNRQDVDKYKVIIPRTGSPTGSIIGKPIISEPALCSSNSYVVIIPQNNTLESAQIIISYLQTKFVRFLVSLRTTTQDKAPKAYSFVPLQDFGES